MMAGFAAAAAARGGGGLPTEESAALVPPSTKVASTRASRAVALRAVTRICTCSDPATPTGSVATLACAASALPGSGAESLSPTGGPRAPAAVALLRTDTVTPSADAAVREADTDDVGAVGVTGQDALGCRCRAPRRAGAADRRGRALGAAPEAAGCAAGMGTRSSEGLTACGVAPTDTTGTTMAAPASKVDAVTMRRVSWFDPVMIGDAPVGSAAAERFQGPGGVLRLHRRVCHSEHTRTSCTRKS